MAPKFTSLFLFLPLLVFMCSYGIIGRELSETEHKEHTHNHMNHLDPSLMVFFTLKDLKVGKTLPIHFPKRDPSKSPKLWPKEEADSIPFSLDQLQNLLKLFSFSPNSPQAKAMENTLRECESKTIKGEVKTCATSLESMLEFTHRILGLDSDMEALVTIHKTKSSVTFQNYTILDNIIQIQAPKIVSCHTMPYPYAVYYCHSQETENRVFRVPLEGDNGDMVESLVVCHMDTSQWSSDHPSFQILGVTPGSSSVSHFFPADHMVWVPKEQNNGFSAM